MAVSFTEVERAFTRSPDGVITYYSAPNTGSTYAGFTYFTGRNDSGVDVGIYKTPNSNPSVPEGFILNGSTFTSIVDPKSVWGTNANGINKWNSVFSITTRMPTASSVSAKGVSSPSTTREHKTPSRRESMRAV